MNGELKAAKTVEGTINTSWIRYIEGTEIVKTVNGVHPDSDSNLELTPSDIGALPKNSKAVSAASADKLSGTITFTGTAETLVGKKQYSVTDLSNGSKIDLSSIIGLKTVNGKSPDSDGNVQIESVGAAINDLKFETNTTWSSQHINEIQPKKLREEIEATCFKVEDEKDIHITVPSKTWLSNSNMIRITSYSSSLDSISLEKTFGLNIYVYVEGESTFYTRYYIPKDNISALVSFPITTVMSILWLGIYQGEDDKHYMTYDRIRDYTVTNVQSDWNVTDTSSDAYIKNKPVIPEAVTEDIISDWGFTKNTGTVKSVNGISPDESGNVRIETGTILVDKTNLVELDNTIIESVFISYDESDGMIPVTIDINLNLNLSDIDTVDAIYHLNYDGDVEYSSNIIDELNEVYDNGNGTDHFSVSSDSFDMYIRGKDNARISFTNYKSLGYINEFIIQGNPVDGTLGYDSSYASVLYCGDYYLQNGELNTTYTNTFIDGYKVYAIGEGSDDKVLKFNSKVDDKFICTWESVAFLNDSGKIPESQLPSYVDDVLEYSSKSLFPETGESGKIYVDTSTNLMYRWSGSTYVNTNTSLALGETSSTAYRGDRGKTAYEHSQSVHAPSNAEANVIDTVKVNGNVITPSAKAVDIAVPTKVSELTNDKGYLTEHQDISGKQDKSTAVTHTASTAVGSESKGVYVNADGVATPMKYSVNKDVPSDAVFTDTTYSESTTSKAGLMPALSGNSEQYLNGNGEWVTPASSGGGTPSVYQQKITKTTAKTPFELTQSNVDSSKCYFKYYGNDDIYEPELHVYLASGVIFNPDTQYIIPCSRPLFSGPIDLTLNDSTDYVLKDDENSYGGYKLYLYSNDEILIACWNSYNSSSSSVKSTYMDYLDFIDTAQFCYYVKNGDSTYIATSLSEITGDYLIGNTEILIPYAGGYLYEDSEGGDIDFLLSCANNNNALSTRMYKFGVTTSMYDGTYQDISLKTNTKYKFSACVKVVSGTVTNIGLNITNSNASSSGIGGAKDLTITNGKVSYEFATGSDLTNFKRFYVYNGKTNQTTSRQVLLYNMMIKEI